MNTKLRDALASAGLSQSELARRLGIHPSRVNRWVQRKERPTVAQVRAMAKLLDETQLGVGYVIIDTLAVRDCA